MKEELFNLTRKEYRVYEYSDTNRIITEQEEDDNPFGVIRSSAPWGHFAM